MKGFVKDVSEEENMEKEKQDFTKENKTKNKQENENIERELENQEEKNIEQERQEDVKFEKVDEKKKKVEKNIDQMDPKKKKKGIKIAILIGVIVVLAIFASTIFALVNINNDKIMSGISISGIDVSGLSKDEAKAKLETIYQTKKEKEIGIQYEEYIATLNPTLMEVNYDIEKATKEAYLVGKGDNIFINNYDILMALIIKRNIPVVMTLNEEVARQSISDMGVNLPGVVIESTYAREESELIITKGKEGISIDTDKLLNQVKEELNNNIIKEDNIIIPVIQKEPELINIEKIHEEIHQEAKDAYFTKNPFTIYPEVEGVDFDIEAAKLILAEEKEEYIIPLTITKPKITINQIGSEAFPNQLATFTTRYDASDIDRTANLRIASQKINGKVILPGETFSYNKALGARTSAAGYKNAKIYEAGEVVDGIGGGICQISSTLYNTVLMANLEIAERRNHQFVTSYVPAGRDATVVYGAIDFKFKNTRQYPVRIVASSQNGIATVSLYGIKEENEYTFTFSTKTVASIPFSTKYVEDGNIATGTERIKQRGANGLKTETYITKLLNGKVVSTKLLSKDTYDAMARIILKGTKGVAPTPQPTPTPTPTPVPTPKPEPTPEPTPPAVEEIPTRPEINTQNIE